MPRHLGYARRDAEKLEARRIAVMARLRRGESTSTIARFLGVSIQSVQQWARCYRLHGEEGLRRLPKSGPHPKLARENWLGFLFYWREDRCPMALTRPSGPRSGSPL